MHNKAIRIFAIIFIIYGIINLFGLANFNDFKELLSGIPQPFIFLIYAFGICYGIMCIICGSKILRLEEWARKTAVILVLISLILGVFTSPIMMRNLRSFYATQLEQASNIDTLMRGAAFLAIIFTIFELSFAYYFTRSRIKGQFKKSI